MKVTKTVKVIAVISAIFAFIAGVLFTCRPIITGAAVVWIIGLMLIGSGIAESIMHFVEKDKLKKPSIFMGILKVILGFFTIRHLISMEVMLSCIFCVYLIMNSIQSIENCLELKRIGGKGWLPMLILDVLIIIIAAGLLFNPIEAVTTTSFVIGFSMMIQAVMTIVSVIVFGKVEKNIMGK